ncbi:MAG: hypothetical protein CMG62_09405 [Candidatus Marinimicrobia bacterium]|nr:hypothetical protein [Candidatus Neomarinimicrobiota bacterium]|tara:strand:- start:34 stop:351 length:318 start_codon:yes stop_codon:yes gene_type:complete
MGSIILVSYEIVNDMLLLKWNDESEHALLVKSIRDNCPCASCAGEKDVFGNVYKGPPQIKTSDSYVLNGIQPVGYYALRPFWADGHSTGIFSFEFLFHLGKELDQ